MKNASGVKGRPLNWTRVALMLCGFLLGSAASAESKLGEGLTDVFALSSSDSAAGTKTFEAEDFVLLSAPSGELRLEVIGFRDQLFDSRQGMRFVFDDFVNEPLHIVLSESSQGTVSLTLAIPGLSAVEFEKRPGESLVRTDGLLEPHSDAHRDHMFKYGIHTGRIEDFMRLAVEPELMMGLVRFQEFFEKFEIKALKGASQAPEAFEHWLQSKAAVCGELTESFEQPLFDFGLKQSHSGDGEIQSWSCIAGLFNLSSAALSVISGAQSCITCRINRQSGPCSECAALVGSGTSSMIVAMIECFGEGPEPEPTPPPALPPPPSNGPLPFPNPGPGGGTWVPITTTETFIVCVDGVCVEQTVTTTTWILVH